MSLPQIVGERYAWFFWTILLLIAWLVLLLLFPSRASRREMVVMSLWTMPLGLTEPLFVPEYWNPPSLFDLAQRTGFDIESLIFSFAIGGIASVLYEFVTRRYAHILMTSAERAAPRHRFHSFILPVIPVSFVALVLFTNLNNLHSAVIAMAVGSVGLALCRPDLVRKMFFGSILMAALYFLYFQTLVLMFPGYVERVWNLPVLTGLWIGSVPLDEMLFALSLGALWSGLYEHERWLRFERRSA